jgi:hypothetical protein
VKSSAAKSCLPLSGAGTPGNSLHRLCHRRASNRSKSNL